MALAASMFAHLNRWGDCSHIRATLGDHLVHESHFPGGSAKPCVSPDGSAAAAATAAGECPACPSCKACKTNDGDSDTAKEVARLQVQLDLKNSELARALKEVKDLEAEVTRVGSNAGGGRKGAGSAGGADSAASEAAALQRTVSKLRVDLKAALRTADDVKKENVEVKQMLTAEVGGDREPLPEALNTCRGLEAKRVSLEEKVKYLKREVWDHRQRKQVACANMLATDRQQWNDRIQTLMVAAITGGGDGRGASPVLQAAARRRNLQAQRRMNVMGAVGLAKTNDEAGDIAAGAHDDDGHGVDVVPEIFNGVGEAANEDDLGVVFRRGILEARDAMLANGTAVDEQWIDQLLGLPAMTVRGVDKATAGAVKPLDADARLKAQEKWEAAVKGVSKEMFSDVEVKIDDQAVVAGFIRRTADAENSMPHVYAGLEREGGGAASSYDAKFAKFKQRRAEQRAKVLHKQAGHTETGAYVGITRVMGRLKQVDSILDPGAPPEYRRCALVGNSQRNLIHEYGEEIDSHDTVFRMNNGPTAGFEKFVGTRTTHRIINNQWAGLYGAPIHNLRRLPLEWNSTLLVSRTDHDQFYATAQAVKQRRPDVMVLHVTPDAANRAAQMLDQMRARIERARGLTYPGKGSPSSGWLSVFLAVQLCDEVDVYGIGMGGCWGSAGGGCQGGTTWHYFESDLVELSAKSREFGEDPHHSFQLEHDMLRALEAGGYITLHTPHKYTQVGEEAKYLRAKFPQMLRQAQMGAMQSKARADMMCVAATGAMCGCPKQCVNPNEAHLRENNMHLKHSTMTYDGKGAV